MQFWKPIFKKSVNTDNFILEPLTPEYNKENHGSYVEQISLALKDTKIRNIALSGNYGVGKSSILQEVVNQHKKRIVEISLSTLAPNHEAPLAGCYFAFDGYDDSFLSIQIGSFFIGRTATT